MNLSFDKTEPCYGRLLHWEAVAIEPQLDTKFIWGYVITSPVRGEEHAYKILVREFFDDLASKDFKTAEFAAAQAFHRAEYPNVPRREA